MKNWIEKRLHRRAPICLPATVVMADGLVRQNVLVVNLSRSGAMLELDENIDLPEAFTLLFNHSLEPCRVIWRRAQFAGLEFEHILPEQP